ncbi:MAG: S53 family peptidase [Chloroflexota bacterium]
MRLLAACCLVALTLPVTAQASSHPSHLALQVRQIGPTVALKGSLRPRPGRVLGTLPARRILHLVVDLRLRNRGRLDRLVQSIYTPGSPLYHHYLTPNQFAARFAPSIGQRGLTTAWLRSRSMRVSSLSPNGLQILVRGPAAAVASALRTPIDAYRTSSTSYVANTAPISIPTALTGTIRGISGINTLPTQHPLDEHQAPSTQSTEPLTPQQLENLYDLTPLYASGFRGQGQTMALVQLTDFSDQNLATFDAFYGLAQPDLSRIEVNDGTGASVTKNANESEAELDIELAHAVAPGAHLLIYEGSSIDQIFNRIVSDDTAPVISTSYGATESHLLTKDKNPDDEMLFEDELFEEAAAQGQAIFGPAGDNGAYDAAEHPSDPNKMTLQVDFPASDPWVTAVGGTNIIPSSDGSLDQQAWANPQFANPTGGGGGLSSIFKRPSYQAGPGVINQYSNGMREVPDIAGYADCDPGYSIYTVDDNGQNPSWTNECGTSASTPFWAAYATLLNQATGTAIGFLNPTLYAIGQKASAFPAAPYNDVTQGNNLYYPATPGWDFASGWGSPNASQALADIKAMGGPIVSKPVDIIAHAAITRYQDHDWPPLTILRRHQILYLLARLKIRAVADNTPITLDYSLTGPRGRLFDQTADVTLGRSQDRRIVKHAVRLRLPSLVPGTYVFTLTLRTSGFTTLAHASAVAR